MALHLFCLLGLLVAARADALTLADRLLTVKAPAPTDPCVSTSTPGTVCADGSVYAGISPDGNSKMFAARCDVGRTFGGSACTGTSTNIAWATNPSASATGITNPVTGRANTNALWPLSNADSPYSAALACHNLTAHGRSDWYLPAINELSVIQGHYVTYGNFAFFTDSNFYYSSTDGTQSGSGAGAQRIRFNNNTVATNVSRSTAYPIRCVRRN